MVGKSYKKTEEDIIAEKRRKARLKNKLVDLSPPKGSTKTDAQEGAMQRNTTVAAAKKRTSELNKNARKTKDAPKKTELSDYSSQLKALLSNKDNLVGIDSGDGRNKYQVQINKLKKRMKAEGLKFSSLLRDIKKQEKAGTFDRGAEGKTKNALRKKLKTGPGAK